MQTLSRAWQGLNLTPGERAFLKLAEGWLITALGAGSAIAYQLLMSGSADYAFILRAAGGAALLALCMAIKKYLAAQTDLPLPEKVVAETSVDTAINQVEKVAQSTPPITPAVVTQPQFVQPVPMGMINLANNVPIPNAPGTYVPPVLRHFGDTGIVPIPPTGGQSTK